MTKNRKSKNSKKYDAETSGAASLFDPAIQFVGSEQDNEYAGDVEKRHHIDPRAQKIFIIGVVLLAVYCITLIFPKGILIQQFYYHNLTLATIVDGFSSNINDLVLEISGVDVPWADFSSQAIKYVVIAITGAGLALCGAVYQGAFRNALVSPSTLGVMTGGSCGLNVWVAVCITESGSIIVPFLTEAAAKEAGLNYYDISQTWQSYSSVLFTFIGCLVVVACVLFIMRFSRSHSTSAIFIIITGQIVAGVFSAITAAIRYYYMTVSPYSAKAEMFKYLATASFWRHYSWVDVVSLLVPIIVVFCVVMHYRQKMMLLAFDEAERRTMGLDSQKTQVIVIGLCTLLTAILISFCGTVGFVGFLVPHLARRLVGPNFRYLLPATAVLGGTFVLGSYGVLLITLGDSYADIVGLFISIAGGIVFLITALRGQGVRNGKFN